MEAQVADEYGQQHGVLHHVAEDSRAEESLARYGHRHVPLHVVLQPHLLQPVLFALQLALVVETRLRHVGQQVAEFDIVAPRLLVFRIAGVAELRRSDAEVHDLRIGDRNFYQPAYGNYQVAQVDWFPGAGAFVPLTRTVVRFRPVIHPWLRSSLPGGV